MTEIGFSVYPSAVDDPSGLTRLRESVGQARPSLDALREGVAAPDPGALQE